uniref:NADH-ubiquinone oxidoreductase chain 1 n=2 Tax=Plasmopara viticola TaxID=143451 RepID=A0A6C0N9X0_PLAVT|nr:NADH dehydrogenase subunit 1 [Plasmopara viticola]QHW07500.1 NADH dehydrogenase subunit 1 [Plasmopara viticola]
MIYIVLKFLILVLPLLISVAYFTLVERKILASIQRRRGPNVVGTFGLLQPLADGLKLFCKETILPSNADVVLFVFAPILSFFFSLLSWAVIPIGLGMFFTELNIGILYLLAISSLGVYGIIIGGWASNSKYSFLGALRSTAQMISYELTIGFSILSVVICAKSLNLIEIVFAQRTVWYCFPLFPVLIVFFISCLAETNRHPFDLPEAEAELVSGYNVEYSAMGFALFFLGEYANMLLMSSLTTILFFGGWWPPFPFSIKCIDILPASFWFSIKICFFVVLFVVARAILPRYRYDQLMRLGWKIYLPFILSWFLYTDTILITFNWSV